MQFCEFCQCFKAPRSHHCRKCKCRLFFREVDKFYCVFIQIFRQSMYYENGSSVSLSVFHRLEFEKYFFLSAVRGSIIAWAMPTTPLSHFSLYLQYQGVFRRPLFWLVHCIEEFTETGTSFMVNIAKRPSSLAFGVWFLPFLIQD